MSQENVDLVRAISAPWANGNYSSAEWAHPDIEVVIRDGPTPGNWRGLPGMAQAYRDFLSAWDDVRTDVEDYHDVDGERVLVLTHSSGRGKTSGLELGPISAKTAVLFHFRGGKVAKLVLYWEREHAYSDLGLAPEASSRE
jgi:ketosteroid isomerase-like protein